MKMKLAENIRAFPRGWMEEASEYMKKALKLAGWYDAAPSLKMDKDGAALLPLWEEMLNEE